MIDHGQSVFGVLLDVVPIAIALAIFGGRRSIYVVLSGAAVAAAVGWAVVRVAAWILRRCRRITSVLVLAALAACAAPKTENTAPMPIGDYQAIPSADHWQPSQADIAAAAAVSVVRP